MNQNTIESADHAVNKEDSVQLGNSVNENMWIDIVFNQRYGRNTKNKDFNINTSVKEWR